MEDSFADPRTRSSRSRGRGRGAYRARGRGRGRGQRAAKIPQERFQQENLGSNEYRFRENEEEVDDENAVSYDAGIDFEEAAKASDYQDSDDLNDVTEAPDMGVLSLDFSSLARVMGSVPLWIRLGEQSRRALRVPEEATIYDFFESSDEEETESKDEQLVDRLMDDVNTLSVEGDTETNTQSTTHRSESQELSVERVDIKQKESTEEQIVESDDKDDFDKWLDEV